MPFPVAARTAKPSHRGPAARLACAALLCLSLLVGSAGPGPARETGPGRPPARPASAHAVASLLATFEQIYSLVVTDYNSCQVKFCYLGSQEKSVTSLAGVSTLRAGGFERAPFLPFQHHGSYGNDAHFGDTLQVSPAELKSLLYAIAARPALQDTVPPAQPKISVMVMRDYGVSAICWEHITATPAEGDTLFQLLHDALTTPNDQATVDSFRHHMVGVRQ